MAAIFSKNVTAAKGADGGFAAEAVDFLAGLEPHIQRSAQGVETEHRIGAFDSNRAHRSVRDQVPVYGVAESHIEAHAVHVHCEALGVAHQGRGVETAVRDVRLERVGLGVVELNLAGRFTQGPQDAGRARPCEIVGGDPLRGVGRLAFGHIGSR